MLFRGRVPSSCSPLVGWSGLRFPRASWRGTFWRVTGRFVGEERPRVVCFARGQRPVVLRLLRASVASPCCGFVSCVLFVRGEVAWRGWWPGAEGHVGPAAGDEVPRVASLYHMRVALRDRLASS